MLLCLFSTIKRQWPSQSFFGPQWVVKVLQALSLRGLKILSILQGELPSTLRVICFFFFFWLFSFIYLESFKELMKSNKWKLEKINEMEIYYQKKITFRIYLLVGGSQFEETSPSKIANVYSCTQHKLDISQFNNGNHAKFVHSQVHTLFINTFIMCQTCFQCMIFIYKMYKPMNERTLHNFHH